MLRRTMMATGGLLPLLIGPARAAERRPFSDAAFEAAQAANRPILIEVTAPWCPTCRAQKPHIDAVLADPRMRDAVLFSIDYDSQKAALRRFNVRTQATLIALRGREERSRATYVSDPVAIRETLFAAL